MVKVLLALVFRDQQGKLWAIDVTGTRLKTVILEKLYKADRAVLPWDNTVVITIGLRITLLGDVQIQS